MKLINSSSVLLLAAVALSSMADRASAKHATEMSQSFEDVIANFEADAVVGTDQPEVEPQAPGIENFASAGQSNVMPDAAVALPGPPFPLAPTAAPLPITCIDRSLEVTNRGPTGVKCIKRNEAICRGDWMFGIVPSVINGTYQVTAWELDALTGNTDIAFAAYDGAKELCVGKTRRDRGYTSFMFIQTESDGTYYLVCNGVGKLDKNPKLKIRVRQDNEKRRKQKKRDIYFYDTIVKFRRGANDDDTLWSANTDGSQSANEKCYWKKVDEPTPL